MTTDHVPVLDAFISYRRSDLRAALALHELLTTFGLRVFLDKVSIAPGVKWEPAIMEAARRSARMLVLWSRNAANSEWVWREWAAARCPLIPIRLDGEPLPDLLGEYQFIEGLGAADRILARAAELARLKVPEAAAMQAIVRELEADGVRLNPEQERALAAFLRELRRPQLWILALLWWLSGFLKRYRPAVMTGFFGAGALAGVLVMSNLFPRAIAVTPCACPEPVEGEGVLTLLGAAEPDPLPPGADPVTEPEPVVVTDASQPSQPSQPSESALRPLRITPAVLHAGTLTLAHREISTHELTIHNANELPVRVDARLVRNDPNTAVPVELDATGCDRLGPSKACKLVVRIGPVQTLEAEGVAVDATLHVNKRTVPVSARVVAAPGKLAPSPSSLVFDEIDGRHEQTKVLRLTNKGRGATVLMKEATSSNDLLQVSSECFGRVLEPHAACEVTVRLSTQAQRQLLSRRLRPRKPASPAPASKTEPESLLSIADRLSLTTREGPLTVEVVEQLEPVSLTLELPNACATLERVMQVRPALPSVTYRWELFTHVPGASEDIKARTEFTKEATYAWTPSNDGRLYDAATCTSGRTLSIRVVVTAETESGEVVGRGDSQREVFCSCLF